MSRAKTPAIIEDQVRDLCDDIGGNTADDWRAVAKVLESLSGEYREMALEADRQEQLSEESR